MKRGRRKGATAAASAVCGVVRSASVRRAERARNAADVPAAARVAEAAAATEKTRTQPTSARRDTRQQYYDRL